MLVTDVVMTCPYSVREITGVGKVAEFVSRGVVANDGQCKMVVPNGSGAVTLDLHPGVELLEVPVTSRPRFRDIFLSLGTARRLLSLEPKPDVFHAHTPHLQSLTAIVIARLRGIPSLVTLHGVLPRPKRGMMHHLLPIVERCTVNWADCVTTVCEATRRSVHRIDSLTIRNGVPVPPPKSGAREQIRQSWGLSDQIICLYAGRLSSLKGIRLAVEAVARVAREDVAPVHLVLIGSGSEDETSDLERWIAVTGLADRFSIYAADPHYQGLLPAADIFLLPSFSEGLPLVLLDAMAAGLPCVASKVGGIPEVVEDNVSGLLVPAGDLDALTNAIGRLTADKSLRTRLGARARARIEASFTEERMVRSYTELYDRLSKAS